ncbi:MAG: protein kinase domain-containing protein [Actinomycetota bacterium]
MNPREHIQDRYVLDAPLGKGGHAEVWCAVDDRLERTVAIKFLDDRLADDPEFLVRFFSEAQTAARISHPNVVPVLDFGKHDGRPYLVMEYVPGGSLADVIGEPMLPERALDLIAQTARGAGAAHALGLVHRDIKPQNILLTDQGMPKLADFGISVSNVQEKLTATGTAIGSPHYVSPEHASGSSTTPASDVYSLGVVLYELLTGRRPFQKDNVTALAIAHVEETPEPPSAHVPDLDPEIDDLVMRALSKDPDARYSDGAQFAWALETPGATRAWAATTPAAAADDDAHETAGERNSKRTLVGAGLVLAFVALLAFGVFAFGGNDEPEIAKADDSSVALAPSRTVPTPTETEDDLEDDEEVAPAPAETPTPTPSPSESETETPAPTQEPTTRPAGEPTTEPSPTSEPTTEPSPTSSL